MTGNGSDHMSNGWGRGGSDYGLLKSQSEHFLVNDIVLAVEVK